MIGTPLQIGSVRLTTNMMLAPMAGYCDLAWRLTCRSFGGVGLASTDLLSPHGLLRGTQQSLDLAATNDQDSPVGMQIYGSDPSLMAQGAKWAADHGATIVDINMGCPVDKVVKKDGGSKLMCDITQAVGVAKAVRKALPESIPLTVKMRIGWDEQAVDESCAPNLACRLIDVGAAAITVHGRTTEMRFKGQCRLGEIKRVVEAVRAHTGGAIPIIGNGDVNSAADAVRMIEDTGCAGVMIGRGSLARPWIFRDCWALQTTGNVPEQPSNDEIAEMIRSYFDMMQSFRNEGYALHKIRSRISWFVKAMNTRTVSCKPLNIAIRSAPDSASVHRVLDEFLTGGHRLLPKPRSCH
ncbi:MAG: tRNA dihydrouridine synthase DusB [Phycisphaera sp.]|nr:MAG: tRNA dihydrouridine synthase DusB [Phycisphaera sp.]